MCGYQRDSRVSPGPCQTFVLRAGTVDSFANGPLTIKLAKGGTLTGRVSDDTEIECNPDATATASGSGGDGDGNHSDHRDSGGHDDDDDDHGDDGSCGAEALTTGRAVEEAELKASNGEAVYEKVELD